MAFKSFHLAVISRQGNGSDGNRHAAFNVENRQFIIKPFAQPPDQISRVCIVPDGWMNISEQIQNDFKMVIRILPDMELADLVIRRDDPAADQIG